MKPFIDRNELVVLGVIQEQHANRCRLFQQWKQLEFPVVHDQLNTNAITEVPVYIAIDAHGIVRGRPRRPAGFDEEFLSKTFPAPDSIPETVDLQEASVEFRRAQLSQPPSAASLTRLADSLILWKPDATAVREAVDLYTQVLQQDPARSDILFRRGAAHRRLYELGDRSDVRLFAKAVSDWETALQMDPNQYIYRRRIEQYGPRLKKPYSFYDWVADARREITERGDAPHPLPVEPNGAELAQRARQMTVDTSADNPDPQNRITRDTGFVEVHVNFVPTSPQPGDVVAVHVGFVVTKTAKWNHETSPLQMWVHQPQDGLPLSSQLISDQTPWQKAESQDPLSLSFELQIPEDHTEEIRLNAFALFNICESAGGQCLFRRTDFTIPVPVAADGSTDPAPAR